MLIIFDFGNTLIRLKKPEEAFVDECLDEIAERLEIDAKRVKKAYREVFSAYERRREETHIEIFSRTLRRAFLRRLRGVSEEDIRKAHAMIIAKWQKYSEPFEDALEALKRLKELGHATALLSNATYHDAVIATLDYHDLLKYIDHPYTSASLGIRKPHPRAFELVVELSGHKKEEALMVGDNAYKDYLGAISAGIKAVLLDRARRYEKNVIHSLLELPEYLERL